MVTNGFVVVVFVVDIVVIIKVVRCRRFSANRPRFYYTHSCTCILSTALGTYICLHQCYVCVSDPNSDYVHLSEYCCGLLRCHFPKLSKQIFFFNIYTRETIRRRASTKRTQTLTIISRSCHLFISFPSDRLIARWCSLHHIGFVSHTVFSFFWQYFSTFHHWYLLFEYAIRLLHNSSRTRPSQSARTTNRALTWGSTQFAHHLKTQVNH